MLPRIPEQKERFHFLSCQIRVHGPDRCRRARNLRCRHGRPAHGLDLSVHRAVDLHSRRHQVHPLVHTACFCNPVFAVIGPDHQDPVRDTFIADRRKPVAVYRGDHAVKILTPPMHDILFFKLIVDDMADLIEKRIVHLCCVFKEIFFVLILDHISIPVSPSGAVSGALDDQELISLIDQASECTCCQSGVIVADHHLPGFFRPGSALLLCHGNSRCAPPCYPVIHKSNAVRITIALVDHFGPALDRLNQEIRLLCDRPAAPCLPCDL